MKISLQKLCPLAIEYISSVYNIGRRTRVSESETV
jgi:hypothetical protein